jgi:polysaccharide biosynthesis transport protein
VLAQWPTDISRSAEQFESRSRASHRRTLKTMNTQPLPPAPGLNLADIYYVLFRHKWKILICSLIGITTAVALYKSEVPPFQSEAKLLVRYIISESKSAGPSGNAQAKIIPDERGTTIMATEAEILNSVDLAREVANSVGAERLLAKAGGGKDPNAAIELMKNNLRVHVPQSSNVIHITFSHPDPDLVQPVLREVILMYQRLHMEAHRSSGMLGDSLQAEADTLRARLAQTEDDLRKASSKAGIISLESTKEAFNNQMTSIRREILNYEAELAGRLAVYEDIKKRASLRSGTATPETEPEIPAQTAEDYRVLVTRYGKLQNAEQEMLLQFRPDSSRVKEIQAQRIDVEKELKALRDAYPNSFRNTSASLSQPGSDIEVNEAATAWLQITSYQAKIKELNSQLDRIHNDAVKLDQAEGAILELRRQKEIAEQTYRYYAANLEQSKTSQTLGNGKVSNLSEIQKPSPPFRDRVNLRKFGLIAISGILTGLAWAFLIELYLDRSVRRPADLQRMLHVPLFLSIPLLKSKGSQLALEAPKRAALTSGTTATGEQSNTALVDTESTHRATDNFRPFHETLRDRLIGYFENKNLTHKPKLVAVTGLSGDAGVTTTAAGLARSLSETGEGNVLLVDMTLSQGAAQQFAKGREACGLDDLLEARSQAHVHENLYVVAESSNSDRLSRNLPQRFTRLIPKLKASDFDYIIFDMPPVSQLSITPRLAGFMDMVLLVVESEKTDREVVQGACNLLAESKVHVGVVLNKTRTYVPARLQQELINS